MSRINKTSFRLPFHTFTFASSEIRLNKFRENQVWILKFLSKIVFKIFHWLKTRIVLKLVKNVARKVSFIVGFYNRKWVHWCFVASLVSLESVQRETKEQLQRHYHHRKNSWLISCKYSFFLRKERQWFTSVLLWSYILQSGSCNQFVFIARENWCTNIWSFTFNSTK